MVWIPSRVDWTKDDNYNFGDLNRVENNTEAIAALISLFGSMPAITVVKNRDIKHIEFSDSLNRIEGNINLLAQRYKPAGWINNKLDWKTNDSFDYNDAIRLEKNLALLHFYYQGNANNFRHCGSYICGEEVV